MSLAAIGFGVCLALSAQPQAAPTFVPVHAFTLAWTHSIEKVRWEEDYTVRAPRPGSSGPQLLADTARVRGSAAGMEPPNHAVLRDGWYEYKPDTRLPPQLRLTRSTYVPDFELCINGACRPMGDILPTDGDVTLLYACEG
jgi:hypothetical protein